MQIVSLTTDYGTQDYYAAELKALILGNGQHIQLVDVSNEVNKFDIVQASFFLKNVVPSFPQGTIHIVAVHCHYASNPEIICFSRENHWFLGPNNGVFSLVFDDVNEEEIRLINPDNHRPLPLNRLLSETTRAIMQQQPISEIGTALPQFTRKLFLQPVITNSQIRATIMHIDYFENVIVNLRKEVFDKVCQGRSFEIYYKPNEPITCISRSYGDVAVGEPLAYFNPSGFLEIAVNMDKASSLLNLHKNETIQINFR